ncbi:hypothetical protein RRG08_026138, partial [Elysia crispata]
MILIFNRKWVLGFHFEISTPLEQTWLKISKGLRRSSRSKPLQRPSVPVKVSKSNAERAQVYRDSIKGDPEVHKAFKEKDRLRKQHARQLKKSSGPVSPHSILKQRQQWKAASKKYREKKKSADKPTEVSAPNRPITRQEEKKLDDRRERNRLAQ